MIIHVLPGDALIEKFSETNIKGVTSVCRECLIEGDLMANSLEDFWNVRASFIEKAYGESRETYREKVYTEFEKLINLPENSEVNLWFEYDLFCQVNLWFCLWLLQHKSLKFYRVAPVVRNENEIWKGFGGLSASQLEECFEKRINLSSEDIRLGKQLWESYCIGDKQNLKSLSENQPASFLKLKEVCAAAIEIESRPKEKLLAVISQGECDFSDIFQQFTLTEGVYGFGDSQVKRILERF